MLRISRRFFLAALASVSAAGRAVAALDERTRNFVAQAFATRQRAIDAGDQAYGAIVVRGGEIVGWGPSRVVTKGDWTAHAEREAIHDAQARLGHADLSDCVMYSTARPCSECERAAYEAKLARMYYGSDATDAGAPRQR